MDRLVLCILDGFGIGEENASNAIHLASTPNYDELLKSNPHTQLKTSGFSVGLPEGQMGNSEVGHLTIGAGRVVMQDLPRISQAIDNKIFFQNEQIQNLIQNKKTTHLVCLLSDGGVHSHIDHLIAIAQYLSSNEVDMKIHAILDGRDVHPKSAKTYIKKVIDAGLKIATLTGRFYAMDRDNRWDRIEQAYNVITHASGPSFDDALSIIKDEMDEFFPPHNSHDYSGIKNGDSIFFINFRADRMRQICTAFLDPDFNQFNVKKIAFTQAIMMCKYSDHIGQFAQTILQKEQPKNTLGEVISQAGLAQLRIAETEKYAHVTYFLNGGREQVFENEERIMIPSPNVTTYDLAPQMSIVELNKILCENIEKQKFHFICVNYANCDMVGHCGDLQAAIKAVEAVDAALGELVEACKKHGYQMLITADHGNIEEMFDAQNQVLTSHTLNPVPLIYMGSENINLSATKTLADIAPLAIELLGIKTRLGRSDTTTNKAITT